MKNKQGYSVIFLTILALAIDLGGRVFSTSFTLPIWCDSIGTFLIAYVLGPVCGAFVGLANNLIYGIFVEQQTVYCIVGSLIGLSAGYFARKKVFETQFATMTFGMVLAICSTVIAVIINTLLYDGKCGNIWGNQVMVMCINQHLPKYLSFFVGQFCVEFLDKLLCVEIVYVLLRFIRFIRKHRKKIMMRIGTFLLFVILTMSLGHNTCLAAETDTPNDYNSYVQLTFAKDEGLLSGEANDIIQTKDGKLWIGTYAGLFKYDGSKFTMFQDISSVKNVNCLFVDEEGRLWVGTNDNGVTIMINEHVINVIDKEDGILSNCIKGIVCDSLGNYYVGTTQGISMISLSGGVEVIRSFDQVQSIFSMSSDANGNVVVTTEHGEVFWIKDGEIVESGITPQEGLTYSSVYFTSDDRLLLGTTANVVFEFSMKSGKPKLSKKVTLEGIERITHFYQSADNEIFVCSDNGVVYLDQEGVQHTLNIGNFTSSIENMQIDYQGNLWFCSSRLGLLQLSKSPFLELFPKINETVVVNATQKWNGLLYCGTDNGLTIIDEESFTKVDNQLCKLLSGVRVRCLAVDQNNSLWVATSGMGVYRASVDKSGKYNIKQFTEQDGLLGMRMRNIMECSDGRIVISGDFGVSIFEGDKVVQGYSEANGLINEKSLCLLEYEDTLYIGSDGGGITKIDRNGTITSITSKDGLSSDVILRMVYDPVSGGVFIVTSNDLCYMTKDGKIRCLDNFPYSNNFDMICQDDGNCWILSSAGIFSAHVEELIENKNKEYPLINSKRGFRNSLIANSWVYREEAQCYFCCDTGVVKVDLEQLSLAEQSYRMIMDYAIVDGVKTDINRSDVLTLSSQVNTISFEPEVLNYSLKDPYVRVYLKGYEKKKKSCLLSELSKVTYSNLKPGVYVLKIEILDDIDGNVVESSSYVIEKETEMYQNWWFKVYVGLIAALVLIWITWFFTRIQTQKTIIKQNLELEYAKKQIEMGNETILSIARTVDAKDSNTSEHSFRVSEYSVAIAKRLHYSEEKCENLRQMALLHDIGKIGIPDAILNKAGRLTNEEYEIMKTHVIKGGEILKDFTMIENVSIGALYHHEKYDGTGYCYGLKGEEIPLDARIIGIADAFDAMTANRVYRKKLELDVVIAELKRCSGTQFDPKLVKVLLSLIEDREIDVEKLYIKSKGE